MKRKLSIIMLLLFGSLVAHAQGNGFNCASFAPTTAEKLRMDDLNRQVYQIMQHKNNNARNASFGCSTDQGGVITLPVVVHIIDSSGVTIASNANVTQMIKNLNDQWRKVTGDGVDMQIQFALAVRDPFGHATSGINRVNGRNTAGYLQYGLNLAINKNDVMNLSYWPSNEYINVYILTKMVGEAGGATSPGSLGKEGIFIVAFNGLFSVGNTAMTHSMGHYLGLYHTHETIFNTTGNDCPDDNDCATQGDLICDTHPHKITDCGSTSCPGSGDLNNSFFNYMSYCGPLTRFTQGQKDRVRLILFSQYRIGLVTTTKALIPVTTPLEASIDSIVYVNDLASPLCGHKLDSVLVRVNNLGTSNVNVVKISTSVAGVVTNIATKSVNIVPGASQLVSVPAITFPASGSYDLSFELLQINSNRIDYDTLNNKVCTSIEPIILQVVTTITVDVSGGGAATGAKTFTCSGIDTLKFNVNTGYEFLGWYLDGVLLSTNAEYFYPIDVNEFATDKQFFAMCRKKRFTITTSVSPANAGTVTPGGTYDYGTSDSLKTHKKPGYIFLYWKKDGNIYSTDSVIPITVDNNANYVAVYDVATGIKNNTLDIDVSLYPNPTNDVINIAVVSSKKFDGIISIVNILGQTLSQERIVNASTSNFQFDVSTFATGSYFISLRDEESNTQEMYKFIVR